MKYLLLVYNQLLRGGFLVQLYVCVFFCLQPRAKPSSQSPQAPAGASARRRNPKPGPPRPRRIPQPRPRGPGLWPDPAAEAARPGLRPRVLDPPDTGRQPPRYPEEPQQPPYPIPPGTTRLHHGKFLTLLFYFFIFFYFLFICYYDYYSFMLLLLSFFFIQWVLINFQ
jgi:hypothetical protein